MTYTDTTVAVDLPTLVGSLPTWLGFTPDNDVVTTLFTDDHRMILSARWDMPAHDDAAAIMGHHAHTVLPAHDMVVITSWAPDLLTAAETANWAATYWTMSTVVAVAAVTPHGFAVVDTDGTAGALELHEPTEAPIPSRAELQATVLADQDLVAAIAHRLSEALTNMCRGDLGGTINAALNTPPTGDIIVRLAAWVQTIRSRDKAIGMITAANADAMTDLWSTVARHLDDDPTALPVLALVAIAGGATGGTVTARAAIDRADRIDPHYPLTSLLRVAVDRGLPPAAWIEILEFVAAATRD